MAFSNRWPDRRLLVLQGALLIVCYAVSVAVRNVVAADTLSDAADLAVIFGGLTVLIGTIVAAPFLLRSAQTLMARVALRVMLACLVVLGGRYVAVSYQDVSIELASLIGPAEADEAETFIAVGPTGQDFRLSGDIREGAATHLAALLEAHPSIKRIHLTSEGGIAEEGQALGQLIAAHGLTTFVPDFCVSACTLVFMGGRERLMMEGARLGFHAPYQEGLLGQAFTGDAKAQRAAYLAYGIAADFVDAALNTKPDDMWFPDAERLIAAHVATGFVSRDRFPDSNLDGTANAAGAEDVVLRNFPVLKAFEAHSPEVAATIADWYLDAYRRGESEDAIVDQMKRLAGAAATLALAKADDATLLGVARYLGEAMAFISDDEPNECAAIGANVDLIGAETILQEENKGADALAVAFVASALASKRDITVSRSGSPATAVALRDPGAACAVERRTYSDTVPRKNAALIRAKLTARLRESAIILSSLAK